MSKAIGWIKCWWHCLQRMHLGCRMSDEKEKYAHQKRFRTTWIGCERCNLSFYGERLVIND